jgi:hypothetical protein
MAFSSFKQRNGTGGKYTQKVSLGQERSEARYITAHTETPSWPLHSRLHYQCTHEGSVNIQMPQIHRVLRTVQNEQISHALCDQNSFLIGKKIAKAL